MVHSQIVEVNEGMKEMEGEKDLLPCRVSNPLLVLPDDKTVFMPRTRTI